MGGTYGSERVNNTIYVLLRVKIPAICLGSSVLFSFVAEILDLGPPSSSLGRIIRNDLWQYDVIHVCNLGMYGFTTNASEILRS